MTSATAVVTSITGTADTQMATGATDGTGTAARFYYPVGITTDGSSLYVADQNNHKIRMITPSSGTLSTMTNTTAVVSSITGTAGTAMSAGVVDGAGTAARFSNPLNITTDGSSLYVEDIGNNKIRKITPSSGTLSAMTSANAVVSSVTGTASTAMGLGAVDGAAASATFNGAYGITTDGVSLFVVDEGNNEIRQIQ
jgi:sugar lactone lactonase YvrE